MGTPPVPLVHHPACRLHDPGAGHPERPERIDAVLGALRAPDLAERVKWHEARPATGEQLERVHPAHYLKHLDELAHGGGRGRGGGNVFTVPRRRGLERGRYVRDLLAGVDAALAGWRPDLLIVSAGFDSLAGDPLGGFTLEPDDMASWTRAFRERVAPAPVVGLLEGGYRLDLLAAGARAHVEALV